MTTLKQIRQKKREKLASYTRRPVHAGLTEQEEDECLIEWLKQKHKLIQPFTERENDVGYSKEDWHIREIARQVLILELLEELK